MLFWLASAANDDAVASTPNRKRKRTSDDNSTDTKLSNEQQLIVDDVLAGTDVSVNAFPGSGKSTISLACAHAIVIREEEKIMCEDDESTTHALIVTYSKALQSDNAHRWETKYGGRGGKQAVRMSTIHGLLTKCPRTNLGPCRTDEQMLIALNDPLCVPTCPR
jgi:superfamily II DNA or RNA helicase